MSSPCWQCHVEMQAVAWWAPSKTCSCLVHVGYTWVHILSLGGIHKLNFGITPTAPHSVSAHRLPFLPGEKCACELPPGTSSAKLGFQSSGCMGLCWSHTGCRHQGPSWHRRLHPGVRSTQLLTPGSSPLYSPYMSLVGQPHVQYGMIRSHLFFQLCQCT